jgi:hypothetical protein
MFSRGQKNGEGTLTYPDGTVLQGSWKDNALQGAAVIQYANQSLWHGTFLHNLKQEGGELTFKGGRMLEEDPPSVEWNSGESYRGPLLDGLPSGRGRYDFGLGSCYEGGFRKGRFEGEGVLTWNGHTIEGRWADHRISAARIKLANGD